MEPSNVPADARRNDPSNDPHCFIALPRKLVPNRSNGVASVNDMDWRKVDADEPPGGNSVLSFHTDDDDEEDNSDIGIQLTLDNTNVNAMAVTGAPSNFPIKVCLPISCARDAVNDRAATFPQLFDCDMMDDDDDDDDDASTILLLRPLDIGRRKWCTAGFCCNIGSL